MIRAETLFFESRLCRALAYACGCGWLFVIWGDAKFDIIATTAGCVVALALSHHKYNCAMQAQAAFKSQIVSEEIGHLFKELKP